MEKVRAAKPSEHAALGGAHELGTTKTKVQAARPIEHGALVGMHELITANEKNISGQAK